MLSDSGFVVQSLQVLFLGLTIQKVREDITYLVGYDTLVLRISINPC